MTDADGDPLVKTSDDSNQLPERDDSSAQEEDQQPGHMDEGIPTPIAVAPGGAAGVGAPMYNEGDEADGTDTTDLPGTASGPPDSDPAGGSPEGDSPIPGKDLPEQTPHPDTD